MRFITTALLISCSVMLSSCTSKDSHDHHHHGTDADRPNGTLYDSVMGIHDAVMPKMSNLYLEKRRLTAKLDSVSTDQKKILEAMILQLDSASNGMNVWMRQFKEPDSVDVDAGRQYLNDQFVKVKKVESDILKSLEKSSSL